MLILPRATLEQRTFDLGIRYEVTFIVDDSYVLPDEHFIEGEFTDKFIPFRDEWIKKYEANVGDCKYYSDCASFFARGAHRFTINRPPEVSVFFMDFWYQPIGAPTGHSINMFYTRVGDLILPRFYEPQITKIITLKPEEIRSCGYLGL